MADLRTLFSGSEVKIFDPHDASMNLSGAEVLDPTVVKRANQVALGKPLQSLDN